MVCREAILNRVQTWDGAVAVGSCKVLSTVGTVGTISMAGTMGITSMVGTMSTVGMKGMAVTIQPTSVTRQVLRVSSRMGTRFGDEHSLWG